MANSSFETQLDVLNKNLKVDGVGKVYISRKAFYLKAYLPDKYNPNWDELKQRWVATGLKAEKANIKQVEKIARKLHYERVTQNFIWENWLSTEEELKPENKSLKLSDIYRRFKDDYFKNKKKTGATENGWKAIAQYLAPRNERSKPDSIKLEHHKLFTADYIISVVEKYPPESKGRTDMMKYCLRLAKFADIPEIPRLEKYSEKMGKYEPKKRQKLDLDYATQVVEELRSDKRFGWAIAALLTYGCRISEVWSLFPEEGGIAECVTINKSKKASLYRYAIALPQENIEKFDLFNIDRNYEYKTPEEYDGERAKAEGYAMAKWLRDYMKDKKLKFQLYDLRHLWGVQSAKTNMSTANAARAMGHSVALHEQTYLETFAKEDTKDVVKRKLLEELKN